MNLYFIWVGISSLKIIINSFHLHSILCLRAVGLADNYGRHIIFLEERSEDSEVWAKSLIGKGQVSYLSALAELNLGKVYMDILCPLDSY